VSLLTCENCLHAANGSHRYMSRY